MKEVRCIDYDYLVICTGSNHQLMRKSSEELSRERREQRLKEEAMSILQAKRVLIVGGGKFVLMYVQCQQFVD
jgi:NADH dehydrogenase FAD-containing subunit